MSEEIEKVEVTKKRGRPKNDNYLGFTEAREYMRSEMIPSRGKFFEWWDRNKPKTIPRFPYRVYDKEWVSWNDFLGTNNKFNEKIGTVWRTYNESINWVHSLKLRSQNEWMDFCKDEGNLPAEIPARPDLVYKEWRSWNHWLGNKPVEAMQAKIEAQKTRIYYIIHEQHLPQNILTFGLEMNGISGMKARWENRQFDIVKMYWYDGDKAEVINNIVTALSTSYHDAENERIVPNVWEILWNLSLHLETVVITA